MKSLATQPNFKEGETPRVSEMTRRIETWRASGTHTITKCGLPFPHMMWFNMALSPIIKMRAPQRAAQYTKATRSWPSPQGSVEGQVEVAGHPFWHHEAGPAHNYESELTCQSGGETSKNTELGPWRHCAGPTRRKQVPLWDIFTTQDTGFSQEAESLLKMNSQPMQGTQGNNTPRGTSTRHREIQHP